ncbi:nuclear transport factor 2 family protein [Nocardia coffeae]|uniref:nuclear transport factor 2 family protein n=1 Tax=Nocardia coffeae TaxID=2873381 RepID=UPI001F1A4DB1|nr:nuclear transport factor 2 family protein [Nocardia coffeae]
MRCEWVWYCCIREEADTRFYVRRMMTRFGIPRRSSRPPESTMIAELYDRQHIHDAVMRYCRGVDRCDAEVLEYGFHAGATDNHTGDAIPVAEANPSFLATLEQAFIATQHNICNEYVEIDGDTARSESYFVACQRVGHGGQEYDWFLGGRYLDTLRRDGALGWRVDARRVAYDWERVEPRRPAPEGFPFQIPDTGLRGTRGTADPSYSWDV